MKPTNLLPKKEGFLHQKCYKYYCPWLWWSGQFTPPLIDEIGSPIHFNSWQVKVQCKIFHPEEKKGRSSACASLQTHAVEWRKGSSEFRKNKREAGQGPAFFFCLPLLPFPRTLHFFGLLLTVHLTLTPHAAFNFNAGSAVHCRPSIEIEGSISFSFSFFLSVIGWIYSHLKNIRTHNKTLEH